MCYNVFVARESGNIIKKGVLVMLTTPGAKIFKCLINSDFFKANKFDVSELIDSSINLNLEDLFALSDIDRDRVLAVLALKTLFCLDNWIKYSTMGKVEKIRKKVDELGIDPDNYTIKDNSNQYSMLEELSDDSGYINVEDITQDIICACWAFMSGQYDTGKKGNLSPLPQNVIERKLYKVSNELHLRSVVPSLPDEGPYDAMDMLKDVLPSIDGANSYELIEFDRQLAHCLYNSKKYDDITFLDWSEGYAQLDYYKLRVRINYLKRTKSGRGALETLFASLGMSKTAIARFLAAGCEPAAVKETKKRGRPKKVQDAPVKRGRGRPRKTAAI